MSLITPHLCYHNHHKVLLIYLVLLESRVIAQDFSCRGQNNENKRVCHSFINTRQNDAPAELYMITALLTITQNNLMTDHVRYAETHPYQLEADATQSQLIKRRGRTCIYQLLPRHREAVFSLFILYFFL